MPARRRNKAASKSPAKYLLIFIIFIAILYSLVFLARGNNSVTPKLGIDLQGGTRVTLTARTIDGNPPSQKALDTAKDRINERVNGLGVAGSEVVIDGSNIVITVPGENSDQAKTLGQTARMFIRPALTSAQAELESEKDTKKYEDLIKDGNDSKKLSDYVSSQRSLRQESDKKKLALNFEKFKCPVNDPLRGNDDPTKPLITCSTDKATKYILEPSIIDGMEIDDASAAYDPTSGNIVQIKFKNHGASVWGDFTSRNIGKPVAFVLDSSVISAPVINQAILGGQTVISGNFKKSETKDLANLLKYGSLPLSFSLSDAETVSSTLGLASLQAGLKAGLVGLILVVLYALFYYRSLGFLITLSLVLSGCALYPLMILLGRWIGFTLDLAGIAGLIIGIGTTADSFVVYFERIKDEVRRGSSYRSAVTKGWQKAFHTILSGNGVSFLAAAILYLMAVGEVKGFAFTLGLTTLMDLVIVCTVTYPLVYIFSKLKFFQNPKHNGMNSVYKARLVDKKLAEANSVESK